MTMPTIDHATLERWRQEALQAMAAFTKTEAELPQWTSALSELIEMLAERVLTLVEERQRFEAAIAFVTTADLAKWQAAVSVMNGIAATLVPGKQVELNARHPRQLEDAVVELTDAAAVLVPVFAALRR